MCHHAAAGEGYSGQLKLQTVDGQFGLWWLCHICCCVDAPECHHVTADAVIACDDPVAQAVGVSVYDGCMLLQRQLPVCRAAA
jgi:hypothetical protein